MNKIPQRMVVITAIVFTALILYAIKYINQDNIIVDCYEISGQEIKGATVLYERRGWYIITGGIITLYSEPQEMQCEGCTPGVTQIIRDKIGTGIAGENVARVAECLPTQSGKKRWDALIDNVLPNE